MRAFIRPTSYRKHIESLEAEIFYGNILDTDSLSCAIRDIDVVFHTAAVYDLSPKADTDLIQRTAIDGTKNLFEMLRGNPKIKKVVYTSSVETIGVSCNKNVLLDESSYAVEFPYPYSYAKCQSEKACLEMAKEYRINTVVCNPSTIIGKDDYKFTPSNRMLLNYSRFLICCFEGGQSLVDVEDVAQGHLTALKYGRNLERYILSGENIEFKQLILIIKRAFRKKVPMLKFGKSTLYPATFFVEGISRLFGIEPIITLKKVKKLINRYNFYDCQKARRELNYSYKGLDIVIPKTLQWLLERYCTRI